MSIQQRVKRLEQQRPADNIRVRIVGPEDKPPADLQPGDVLIKIVYDAERRETVSTRTVR
jgi:hypothetical protein